MEQENTNAAAETFKAIESQEALDAIIRKRLQREADKYAGEIAQLKQERETLSKENEGYKARISELDTSLKSANESLSDMTSRAASAEASLLRASIAGEYHIPAALADRIAGDNEEAMRKDAEELAKLVSVQNTAAPLFSNAPSGGDGARSMYRPLLQALTN